MKKQTLIFVRPNLSDAHISIGDNVNGAILRKSHAMSLARGLYTDANGCRGFNYSVNAEIFVIHSRDFNMSSNSIVHWARDALLIFGNDSRGTPTSFLWIICPPARGRGVHKNTVFIKNNKFFIKACYK